MGELVSEMTTRGGIPDDIRLLTTATFSLSFSLLQRYSVTAVKVSGWVEISGTVWETVWAAYFGGWIRNCYSTRSSGRGNHGRDRTCVYTHLQLWTV